MAVHNLFIDIDRQVSVSSATDSSSAVDLPFVQGDSLQLKVYLLTGFSRLVPYTKVPVAGITIEMAIGTRIGNATTYYTQQFTWTASSDTADPYFSATLPMNTAAITSLLGGSGTASTYFEVKMLSGGTPVTVLSKAITVTAAVIKDGGTVVAATPTPASVEVVSALFVPKVFNGHILWTNPTTGKGVDMYIDETGALRTDPIS